jgi:hypothetical protein
LRAICDLKQNGFLDNRCDIQEDGSNVRCSFGRDGSCSLNYSTALFAIMHINTTEAFPAFSEAGNIDIKQGT